MSESNLPVWQLKELYKGDTDPRIDQDLEEVSAAVVAFRERWEPRADWLEKPLALRLALDAYADLMWQYGTNGRAGYYFFLRRYVDQDNPVVQARNNKIDEIDGENSARLKFFELRLAKLPLERQHEFLADPILWPYRYWLDRLFRSGRYLLDEEAEKILTETEPEAHSLWVRMTDRKLSGQKCLVLNEDGSRSSEPVAKVLSLISSGQKAVRDEASKAYCRMLRRHAAMAEAEVNAILTHHKTVCRKRGYERPDTERYMESDISGEVIDSLIAAVSKAYPIARRYYGLKAKLLGQAKLAYHERAFPIGSLADARYTYEEAVALTRDVLCGLDDTFATLFDQILAADQIDAEPREGKAWGAFGFRPGARCLPHYLLMNFTGRYSDVTTLAHEVGHMVHNRLNQLHQPALYCDTSLATAEVASVSLEFYVHQKLQQRAEPEMAFAMLMAQLEDIMGKVFAQIAIYRFETRLHGEFAEKGYLSAREISSLYQQEMAACYGRSVSTAGAGCRWIGLWHIRRFFYVYSYATGLLIALAILELLETDRNNVARLKDFLSSGCSDSPRNLFLIYFGVDIEDPAFLQRGLERIGRLVDEAEGLAKELGKIK